MAANPAPAVSCVECQRRKQKCNRQFPCNHCLKRGVSHLCRFVSKAGTTKPAKDELSSGSQSGTSRKHNLEGVDTEAPFDGDPEDGLDASDVDVSSALNGLGYMSHHHHLVLGHNDGPKAVRDVVEQAAPEQSEELKAALLEMPKKAYTDCLVDNWLNGANHHYYALYPPEFRTQYDGWWATPRTRVTPELTSLILRVCACSLHFILDDNVRLRLESELGTDVVTLARRLHSAAEKLAASIAPGKGDLTHVQQLFLTAFWFKSAENWTESWHALSKAVRAANEIGLHQDAFSEGLSEFDREMRRRVWVVLYLWDFALGSMLSRPLLINQSDCTLVMPTLALERNPERPDQPSPFRHMILHCQLCSDMAAELGRKPESSSGEAEVAQRLREVTAKWFDELPAEYAVTDPDTRWDAEYDWVVFQRRYLHLVGHMALFSRLRPFVMLNSGKPMTAIESALREAGVVAALDLMDVSWRFFENLASAGGKFHYSVFCMFDAATVLCSGLLHDESCSLPHREVVFEAIQNGLRMLGELSSESKTTAALYRILKRLLVKLPQSWREQRVIGATKRAKTDKTMLRNKVTSPLSSSNPAAQCAVPIGEKGRRCSNTSSASVGTLEDSSTVPPSSVSSVSVTDGGQSVSVQAGSDDRVRGNPAMASGSASQVDGPLSSSSFMPRDSLVPSYPLATNSFVPATSTSSCLTSDVFATPEGFVPSSGYHQYTSLPVGPPAMLPFSHAGSWQAPQITANEPNMNVLQNSNVAGFDSTDANILEYWDWQGLHLGHPVSWEASSGEMSRQVCDGQGLISSSLGSSVAESSPRSQ
ncbi:hypothetical protein VTK26DRAFT_4533 [Humicola hyalothermophila]